MFRMFRKNYRRAVAYLLTVAMVFTNLSWNAGAAFAAGESESALFLVDGEGLKQEINQLSLGGGDVFDFSSLELIAEKKSIRNQYKAALGVGNVYELGVEIDSRHAPEETSMRVFYNAATRKVVFLFFNESEQVISFRVNVDGYETTAVEVKPNAERMMDEEDRVFAENYEAGDMIDDEVKKVTGEVVKPAATEESKGDPTESAADDESAAPTEESSASESETDAENAGDVKDETSAAAEESQEETKADEGREETKAEESQEETTAGETTAEETTAETEAAGAGEEVASISRHAVALVATSGDVEIPNEGQTAPENLDADEDEDEDDQEASDEGKNTDEGTTEEEPTSEEVTEATTPAETAAPTESVETTAGEGETDATTAAAESTEATDPTKASVEADESVTPTESAAPSEGETAAPSESDAENKEKEEGQRLEEEEAIGELKGKELPTVTVLDHVNARAFQVSVDDVFEIVAKTDEDRFAEYDFVLPLFMPDPENEESEELIPFAMPIGGEMLELKGVDPETEGVWVSSVPEILSIDETGFVETHTLGEVEVSFTYEAFAEAGDSADTENAEGNTDSEVTLTWKVLVYDEQYNMLNFYCIDMIAYPRSDWELTGDFKATSPGIPLNNGQTSSSSKGNNITVHAVREQWDSKQKVAYCIEPGVGIDVYEISGTTSLEEKDENWWQSSECHYNNGVISTEQIKILVGRVIDQGYHGDIPGNSGTGTNIQNVQKIIATQLLVWEVILGERNAQFEKIAPKPGCQGVKGTIPNNHTWKTEIFSYYDQFANQIAELCKTPNLPKSVTLEWSQQNTRFEASLTDSNNAISGYTFENNSNVNVSRNGNTITVWTNEPLSGTVELKANGRAITRKGLVVWSDGENGTQDIVSYDGATVTDIDRLSINVNTSGTAKINLDIKKINGDTNETLSGAEFSLSGPAKSGNYKTGADGRISFTDLTPGSYTLTETKAPAGYKLPNNPVTIFNVSNGGVVSITSGSASLSNDKKTMTISNKFEVDITVIKVDKKTGQTRTDLSEVVFEMAAGSGPFSGDYTIGDNGTIKIQIDRKGHYTLREKVAPKGYLKLDKTFGFEVESDGSVKWDADVKTGGFVHETDPKTITIPNDRTVNLRIIKTVNEKDAEKSKEFADEKFVIKVQLGDNTTNRGINAAQEKGKRDSEYKGDGVYRFEMYRSIVDKNGKPTEGNDNSVTITGIPTGTKYTITEELKSEQEVGGNQLGEIVTDKPTTTEGFIEGILTDKVEAEDNVENRIETVTIRNDYFNSKTRDIKVTKSWRDETGEELEENLRPAAIKVQLMYAKAEKDSEGNLRYSDPVLYDLSYVEDGQVKNDYQAEATLEASEDLEKNWTTTFANLPIYDWDGNEYQYSVVETEIIPNKKWGELGWNVEGTPEPAQIEGTNIFKVFGADKVMKQNEETGEWEETGAYAVRGVFVAAASDARTLLVDEESETSDGPALYPVANTWIPAEKLGTGFTIRKIDSETGEPLKNAVFVMKEYKDPESEEESVENQDEAQEESGDGTAKEPELMFELTTNEQGVVSIEGEELPIGRYVLWEKTAPEGYLPIPEEMKLIVNIRKDLVEVSSDNDRNWKNRYEWSNEAIHADGMTRDDLANLDLGGVLTIPNDPIKGRLHLSKHIRLNGTVERWLNEFSFGIYDSEGTLVDTIVVKANDEVVSSKELRYGKYTVAEILESNTIGGYRWTGAVFELNDGDNKVEVNLDSSRFQFNIEEEGEIVRIEAANDYTYQPGGGGGGGGGGSRSRSGGGGGGTTIDDAGVPLANLPEELVTLPEEDVPLAGLLPSTGDARNIAMWLLLFGGAGIGMLLAAMGLKKKKDEE